MGGGVSASTPLALRSLFAVSQHYERHKVPINPETAREIKGIRWVPPRPTDYRNPRKVLLALCEKRRWLVVVMWNWKLNHSVLTELERAHCWLFSRRRESSQFVCSLLLLFSNFWRNFSLFSKFPNLFSPRYPYSFVSFHRILSRYFTTLHWYSLNTQQDVLICCSQLTTTAVASLVFKAVFDISIRLLTTRQ